MAVLGLIHVSKAASFDALTLLMASRAFTAVARAVLFIAAHPDNEEQRLLGQEKNNLGRSDLPTLLFRIRGALVTTTAAGEEVWTGQLVWDGESDLSIRQVLERAAEREGDRAAVKEAAEWLLEYLTAQGGTAPKKTVIAVGNKAGYSRATLGRARHLAGVRAERRGFPSASYWIAPPPSSQSTQSTQSTHVSGSGGPESN